MGIQVQPRQRIGKAVLPAGELGVVVAVVLRVPAEDHVAETEAVVDRGEELVAVEVLAAQDAVDVGDGDLHLADRRLAQRLDDGVAVLGLVAGLFHWERAQRDAISR